jgi:hypothetical protein
LNPTIVGLGLGDVIDDDSQLGLSVDQFDADGKLALEKE